MKSIRHFAPALRIFTGSESLTHLQSELERVGSRRAVLICGATLGRSPALEMVKIAAGDRLAGIYSGVCSSSPVPAVQEAADALERMEADAVIALGGGSAIVTARGACIMLAEKRDVRSLCTTPDGLGGLNSPKLLASKLPNLVIPTTPTTASIKAGSALFDPEAKERLALFDPATRAKAIFIHPDLIGTASRTLFAEAATGTLVLATEGLMSLSGDAISDALLMQALRLLFKNLPRAASSDDLQARTELMMASLLCGHGSDYTGAGIAIPLGHAIGTRSGVAHGIAEAVVLPHVLTFNAQVSSKGIEKLAVSLGLIPAGDALLVEQVVQKFKVLFQELGLPSRLRDIGIPRDSLQSIAAVSIDDWYMQNNPRTVHGVEELQQLLECTW